MKLRQPPEKPSSSSGTEIASSQMKMETSRDAETDSFGIKAFPIFRSKQSVGSQCPQCSRLTKFFLAGVFLSALALIIKYTFLN
jgi:hypothetical protein